MARRNCAVGFALCNGAIVSFGHYPLWVGNAGAAPLVCKGAGFDLRLLTFHAQPSETLLRRGRSPLRDLQFLPAPSSFGNTTGTRSLHQSSRSSPFAEEFPRLRIRVDARTCPSADQRTGGQQPVQDPASAETEDFPNASQDADEAAGEPVAAEICGSQRGGGTFLAAAFLRLQRPERKKVSGEARLHACESGEARAGSTSERLAVE